MIKRFENGGEVSLRLQLPVYGYYRHIGKNPDVVSDIIYEPTADLADYNIRSIYPNGDTLYFTRGDMDRALKILSDSIHNAWHIHDSISEKQGWQSPEARATYKAAYKAEDEADKLRPWMDGGYFGLYMPRRFASQNLDSAKLEFFNNLRQVVPTLKSRYPKNWRDMVDWDQYKNILLEDNKKLSPQKITKLKVK